jgi:hypothetical protein
MRALVGLAALVALVALIIASAACKPVDSATIPCASARIVIVDAGSSGTRAHVYQESGATLIDLTPGCDLGPPLAATGPDAVLGLWGACGIAKLVDANTPIRVYATAGMRSYGETEPARAAQIHSDIEAALRELGHLDVDSRTIEGIEEARFAWVAANVMLDSLGDASVGILELGGSSTQVAFVPDDPADATETLSLDGRDYPLFAVSYLHCGANDARQDLAAPSCFFPGCESDPECAASLTGTPASQAAGELATCTSTIERGLRNPNARCDVARTMRPAMASERFVLIDNFASVVRSLGAVDVDGDISLERLWAAAGTACETAWPELADPLRTVAAARRSRSCFDAGLTQALLQLYGLADSAKLFVLQQTPKWALGAAYVERSRVQGL